MEVEPEKEEERGWTLKGVPDCKRERESQKVKGSFEQT